MKRSETQMKKILPIQIGIGVILILLFVLLFLWLKRGFIGYMPKEETVQYIYGNKLENSVNTQYTIDEEDKSVIHVEDGDKDDSIINEPILFERKDSFTKDSENTDSVKTNRVNKITITSNMMYSNPEFQGEAYRINYFTTVENRDGLINLSKDGKKAQVSGGYLYDGNNLFIFLEPVTLMVGNKEINLGTMSYVRVNYRNNMEIYNSITGDYEFIAQGDLDVYAFVKDVYVIDLCRDSIIKNDEESLIFTAVDTLDVIPMN